MPFHIVFILGRNRKQVRSSAQRPTCKKARKKKVDKGRESVDQSKSSGFSHRGIPGIKHAVRRLHPASRPSGAVMIEECQRMLARDRRLSGKSSGLEWTTVSI
jgi:hypothetical protein